MRHRGIGGAVLVALCVLGAEAQAGWEQPFRTTADTKIYAYRSDQSAPDRMLLGIEGGILESKNGGKGWKRVLTVPAGHAVLILRQEPETGVWWAGTQRALYRSADDGKRWEPVVRFGDSEGPMECFLPAGPVLYAGFGSGLQMSADGGSSWRALPQWTGQKVYQIERDEESRVWVAAAGGVHTRSSDGSWRQIYRRPVLFDESAGTELTDAPDPQAGSGAETDRGASKIYFWFSSDGGARVVDGTRSFRISVDGKEIETAGSIRGSLAVPPAAIGGPLDMAALAFADGVRLESASGDAPALQALGWPGSELRSLVYERFGDRLVAVSERGVFTLDHPEISGYLEARLGPGESKAGALMRTYDREPGILELQEAAMRYAEVHPEKIMEWRRAAARRAWLPTLSFGVDRGRDETVDIDRGGTGDADRFIQGPAEKDDQWGADVSWDLGDLIWSTDQTTIDNRSKLMVQLRDELLTQLNHLYYSRRRLQISRLIEGSSDLQKEIDRTLQIEEHTAGIDALTGGYFSRGLRSSGAEISIDPGIG